MATATQPTLAYLAGGKLKLKSEAKVPKTLESKFAETIRDRAIKSQQRHAWKTTDASTGLLARPALWGKGGEQSGVIPISITSICRGGTTGQLLYSLETDSMCCVLALDEFGAEERRIWNDHKKTVTRLNVNAGGDIVGSVEHQHGTANIGVKPTEEGS
ncbi:MAG: hypothetical protein JWM68_4424, partial [Verrucomicrobiales bacterium]|nr:hypothetical protein [Verrucomicrobiales bacterium]